MDIKEGFEDIKLNSYYNIKLIEYSSYNNASGWNIKGEVFAIPEPFIDNMLDGQLIANLESFIKRLPRVKAYSITKDVLDNGSFSIEFDAQGLDTEVFEKFIASQLKVKK